MVQFPKKCWYLFLKKLWLGARNVWTTYSSTKFRRATKDIYRIRSKRRKTEELRSTTSKEMLLHAAQITLQTSGHRTASQMLKEVVISPNHAKKYKTAYIKSMRDNRGNKLTTLCALSMFVEADLYLVVHILFVRMSYITLNIILLLLLLIMLLLFVILFFAY